MDMNHLNLGFGHGLGDCSNFSKALLLWKKRGFDIGIETHDNKAWLWRFLGFGPSHLSEAVVPVPFGHPPDFNFSSADEVQGNKTAWNLFLPPMPNIGERASL